jgi:hypothetical protein
MNCQNFTEAPGQARHYLEGCATSILRLDLEAGVGRTHRYINDTASFVKHGFGYGLSYATFAYSALTVHKTDAATDTDAVPPRLSAQVHVTNTGTVAGVEVVQVYASGAKVAGLVTPIQNLLGFVKVELQAGASKTVHVPLDAFQLETAQADGTRVIVPGAYTVSAGGHQPHDAEGAAGSSGPSASVTLTL